MSKRKRASAVDAEASRLFEEFRKLLQQCEFTSSDTAESVGESVRAYVAKMQLIYYCAADQLLAASTSSARGSNAPKAVTARALLRLIEQQFRSDARRFGPWGFIGVWQRLTEQIDQNESRQQVIKAIQALNKPWHDLTSDFCGDVERMLLAYSPTRTVSPIVLRSSPQMVGQFGNL